MDCRCCWGVETGNSFGDAASGKTEKDNIKYIILG